MFNGNKSATQVHFPSAIAMLIYLTVLTITARHFPDDSSQKFATQKIFPLGSQKEVPVVLFVQFVVQSGNPPFTLLFWKFWNLIFFEVCLVVRNSQHSKKLGHRVGVATNLKQTVSLPTQEKMPGNRSVKDKNRWKTYKKNISDESTSTFFLSLHHPVKTPTKGDTVLPVD